MKYQQSHLKDTSEVGLHVLSLSRMPTVSRPHLQASGSQFSTLCFLGEVLGLVPSHFGTVYIVVSCQASHFWHLIAMEISVIKKELTLLQLLCVTRFKKNKPGDTALCKYLQYMIVWWVYSKQDTTQNRSTFGLLCASQVKKWNGIMHDHHCYLDWLTDFWEKRSRESSVLSPECAMDPLLIGILINTPEKKNTAWALGFNPAGSLDTATRQETNHFMHLALYKEMSHHFVSIKSTEGKRREKQRRRRTRLW